MTDKHIDAESESVEPVGAICDVSKSGLSYAAFTKTLPIGTMLYTAPPADNLIAELVEALEGLYKFASAKSTRIDTLLKRAKEAIK